MWNILQCNVVALQMHGTVMTNDFASKLYSTIDHPKTPAKVILQEREGGGLLVRGLLTYKYEGNIFIRII